MISRPRNFILSCIWAGSAMGGCAAPGLPLNAGPRDTVVVTCASPVQFDTGACQIFADQQCGARADLVAVLSSTPLGDSRLYTSTVRYKCPRP